MKKYHSIYAGIAMMLCWCCSNPVEDAKIGINDGVVLMLSQDIGLINSTLDFVRYAVPENYWYRNYSVNHTTTAAVIEKLKDLEETINGFEYNDDGMQEAKSNLLKEVKKIYEGLNKLSHNEFLSGYLYNLWGMNANIYSVFGGEQKMEAPESLKKVITEMDSVIRARYFYSLPESIFQLERMAIGDQKITSDEFKEIRAHTLQTVRDTLSEYVYYEEEEYKNALIENIIKAFTNQYPVNDAYAYISREHAYSGVLYQVYLTQKGTNCDYENLSMFGGHLLLADNGKAIYCYECSDGSSTDYHIGKFKIMDGQISCIFNKEYRDISTENLAEGDEDQKLELMNAGKIRKMEKDEITLEPTDCSQYHFIFKTYHELPNGNQQEECYVCRLASLREYNSFTDDLKNIDDLKRLFE